MILSVLVPNYNGSRTILRTLESIFSQLPPGSEVLLIDDNSTDQSRTLVEGAYPQVRIHVNAENLGAAASRNRGIELSQGELILFIDADVSLAQGSLPLLRQHATQADVVFPRILYPNQAVMYPVNDHQASYLLISPVFLIRRSAFDRVTQPFFDETYGTYCEDTDFFLRMYLAGVKSLHCSDAVAWHNVNPEPGNREKRYFLEVRNMVYGAVKFAGIREINRFDHAFRLGNIIKVIACGVFNFNLFDLQARGYRKYGGAAYDLKILLGQHDKLTSRSRLVLISLAVKAVLWNLGHLSQALKARRQVSQQLNIGAART